MLTEKPSPLPILLLIFLALSFIYIPRLVSLPILASGARAKLGFILPVLPTVLLLISLSLPRADDQRKREPCDRRGCGRTRRNGLVPPLVVVMSIVILLISLVGLRRRFLYVRCSVNCPREIHFVISFH
ncbi:hypothetical protein MLD38_014166 [Melastoma candidum]|uniref:Uncharacterized protein n=1 Tax=Melastoma candidum TaxID=119954 RepID=A0ACB9RG36_9MYRT|nr:hypothetical protein MLD38_014166 [Melastoma candidum]